MGLAAGGRPLRKTEWTLGMEGGGGKFSGGVAALHKLCNRRAHALGCSFEYIE